MTTNEMKKYMFLSCLPILSEEDAKTYSTLGNMIKDSVHKCEDNNSIIGVFGNYTNALYFSTDYNTIETGTINQIKAICNNPIFERCKVRMMPDAHPGKVGPIGLTIRMPERIPIMPALIGNDIGCGMLCMKFKPKHKLTASDFQKLDKVIKEMTPFSDITFLTKLQVGGHGYLNMRNSMDTLDTMRTLGGGNHFIEIDKDDENNYYLIIHSGSRSMGNLIYTYYMDKYCNRDILPYELTRIIDCDGIYSYIDDVVICIKYAETNRKLIGSYIMEKMKWNVDYENALDIKHNYIDFEESAITLHKGSISAKKGEKVVIPINMRDGVILGTGKGNEDWNCSAPHGAGRIMKRSDVANNVTLNSYKKSMEGIYSPSINKSTLDECPMAYREIDAIKNAISDTVEIDKILKPVYNFKNGGKE